MGRPRTQHCPCSPEIASRVHFLDMDKPAVFIASSVEGLPVADAINLNLDHEMQCTLWRNGTFKLGSDALGDLVKKSSAVDFAIFVFSPDDISTIRDKAHVVARDNVVFELGLFIGALGKDRCYVVKPRGVDMHLPSDLAGVTTADFVADRPDGDVASALNAACKQIKDRVKELGMLPRSATGLRRPQGQHVANPPNYDLSDIDLAFLGQCAHAHVAYPQGRGYHQIANSITAPDYRIALSVVKLDRLGYIERTVEEENRDTYYSYRATEAGLDAFIKYEERYAEIQEESDRASRNRRSCGGSSAPRPRPPTAPPVSKSFEDMDDDIPF